METKLRWIKRADLDHLKEMCPLTDADFIGNQTTKSNVSCLVADTDGAIEGFVFYEMRKNKIKINYLFVKQSSRRRGIGSSLMSNLISKLNEKRNQIHFSVSEYDLGTQLFLKNAGFRATNIKKDQSGSCDYNFLYEIKGVVIA